MRGRDPFQEILSRREPSRARVSTSAGTTADQSGHRGSTYEAAGGEARGELLVQVRGSLGRSSAGRFEASDMPNDRERAGGRARHPTELRSEHCGCGADGLAKETGPRRAISGSTRCAGGAPLQTSGALTEARGKAIAARSRAGSIVGCAVVASTRPAVRTISDSVKRRQRLDGRANWDRDRSAIISVYGWICVYIIKIGTAKFSEYVSRVQLITILK